MDNHQIMVIEDDLEIRKFISLYLGEHGYDVVEAGTGKEALAAFEKEVPDLLLLDVLLPDTNGFELCRTIRKESRVPIIFLTCKWETNDVVNGLELGADDYITKPFEPKVLLARVRANLRKRPKGEDTIIIDSLHIDLKKYKVTMDGKDIPMYAKELQLLIHLAKNPNRVYSAEQLYDLIWGPFEESILKTVKVHISNIRKKIEEDPKNPKWIKTIRGLGYRFEI